MENSHKKELYNRPLVFNILKPAGPSSFDIIRHFKKNLPFRPRKIGHFGTLDPFASGVFLIGLNSALRLNELAHQLNRKTYLAIGKLGHCTDSGDRTGEKTSSSSYRPTLEQLNKALNLFIGQIYYQIPPYYSAVKHQGKPLYDWARKGVFIDKEPVVREVYSAKIIKYQYPYISVEISVSSGTYIRKFFEDFLEKCETKGHLISLVRTQIGNFHLKSSILKRHWPKLDESQSHIESLGHNLLDMLPISEIKLNQNMTQKFLNGCKIEVHSPNQLNWITHDQTILGIGKSISEGLGPHIVFRN